MEQLLQFLSNKSKLQETTESRYKGEKPHKVKTSHFEKRVNFQGRRHGYAVQHNGRNIQCIICNANHHIYHCKKFTDLSLSAKIEKVKQLRLCLNCLRSNHLVGSCSPGMQIVREKAQHVTASGSRTSSRWFGA